MTSLPAVSPPAVLVAAAAMSLLLGACSQYPDRNGRLALARDGGRVVVLVHTCHGAVEQLDVAADRQGLASDARNPVLGRLRARRPLSGDVTVDLRAPGPDWEVVTPVSLPTDPAKGIIVTARQESARTEMQQADALMGQIDALSPGHVLLGGDPDRTGTVAPVEDFRAQACPR